MMDLMQPKSRIIDWNVKTLGGLLKKVVASRDSADKDKSEGFNGKDFIHPEGASFLDEVAEVIPISSGRKKEIKDVESFQMPETIEKQLTEYVMAITHLYPKNSFHSFAHASHVL